MVLKRPGITNSVYRSDQEMRERAFQAVNLPPTPPRARLIYNIFLSFPQLYKLLHEKGSHPAGVGAGKRLRPISPPTFFWALTLLQVSLRHQTLLPVVQLNYLHPTFSAACERRNVSIKYIVLTSNLREHKTHYLFYNQHLRNFSAKSTLVNANKGKLRGL